MIYDRSRFDDRIPVQPCQPCPSRHGLLPRRMESNHCQAPLLSFYFILLSPFTIHHPTPHPHCHPRDPLGLARILYFSTLPTSFSLTLPFQHSVLLASRQHLTAYLQWMMRVAHTRSGKPLPFIVTAFPVLFYFAFIGFGYYGFVVTLCGRLILQPLSTNEA